MASHRCGQKIEQAVCKWVCVMGKSLEYVLGHEMMKCPEEIGRAGKNEGRSRQRKTGEQESLISTATLYQVVQRGGAYPSLLLPIS